MDLEFHTTVIILNVLYLCFYVVFVLMPSFLIVCFSSPASRGLQEYKCQTTEEGQY